MSPRYWRLAVLLLAAAVLWPASRQGPCSKGRSPCGVRMAAGQGLAVSSEQLGAGEAATATQLEYFEESLTIATTGGRGRGGRGASGRLGASAFTDVDQLQQLQRGIYYLAASAKSFPSCQHKYGWRTRSAGDTSLRSDCNNFVPSQPRDQKSCSTCVSQSVATAIQMAAAAALEKDVDDWEVNAATLYYCSDGGRSCSTGFDIQENLHEVIDKAPELLRPSRCLKSKVVKALNDTVNEPNVNSWLPVCRQALQDCAATAKRDKPYLKCTYTSLSTFWEIQRWIRNNGAVITRLTIYDDFNVQINKTARNIFGEDWPTYRFNNTAKPLYGHAAVIVGYDNDKFTWTLLNSWGSGNDPKNSRSQGVTADGLIKVQMGLAGVGTPDQTYGVTCAPLPGSTADPYGVRQFYGHKSQLPVEFINPAKDKLDLNVPCFKYTLRRNDTIASVVDAFGVIMEDFVLQQRQGSLLATTGKVWGYENVTYKLGDTTDEEVLDKMLRVADDVFKRKNEAPYQPYIQCWHYNAAGVARNTTCNSQTGAKACLQYGAGTVGCALYYANIAVPETLSGPSNNTVMVCNITHPHFADPRDSQPRALKRLNVLDQSKDYCFQEDASQCKRPTPVRHVGCNGNKYVTYIWNTPVKEMGLVGKTLCFENGMVRDSWGLFRKEDLDSPIEIGSFEPAIIDAFLNLKFLQAVNIYVTASGSAGGALPLQLAGLVDMKHLVVRYNCMTGTFPTAWQWRNLSTLHVGQVATQALRDDEPQRIQTPQVSASCGIQGPLPANWPKQMPSIRQLLLGNNRLSGTLPRSFSNWKSASLVWLSQNKLSGSIPDSYTAWNLQYLSLSYNMLSGGLPSFGTDVKPSPIQQTLVDLDLSANAFTGTLPFSWPSFSKLTYLKVSDNNLEGQVPLSWINFKTLRSLNLTNNPKLAGCIPIPSQKNARFLPEHVNTQISGSCPTQRGEAEQQQRKALDMLPLLFYTDTKRNATAWQMTLTQALQLSPTLSGFYGDGKDGTAPRYRFLGPSQDVYLDMQFESINGGFYITEFESQNLGVRTTALVKFLPQLPLLKSFVARHSIAKIGGTLSKQPFPIKLAAVAPPSLKELVLSGQNLCCRLPEEWGSWSTIEILEISANSPLLVGTLPEWKGMNSLKSLSLFANSLKGTLPASYGLSAWSKQLQLLNLGDNEKLSGTIPSAWTSITGKIDLNPTGITGCVPDQLYNTVEVPKSMIPVRRCSTNSTELVALKALRSILDKSGSVLASWQEDPDDTEPPTSGAPPGPAPYWCRKWVGVTCAPSNQVVGINFQGVAGDGLSFEGAALGGPLLETLQLLSALQTLDLSGCNIAGALPTELSKLANLRYLNLSGNTGLTGTLLPGYAAVSFLQTLDVSSCSIIGTLPTAYAALQQLTVFRAANTKITGQLPESWGLLQNLQVLDLTNAQLTGNIPAAWFDSVARAAVLRAVSAAAAPGIKPTAIIGLTQLTELRLAGNRLTGSLPDSIELLGSLRVLDLSGNAIGGRLPLKLATLIKLQELSMRSTTLSGPLPASFARLTELTTLDLAKNSMTGTLPDIWVSLTKVRTINMASNMLSGVVPQLWGQMGASTHSLQLLVLTDNPCMDPAAVKSSIKDSGILSNGLTSVLEPGAATRSCTGPTP